ncbi:hypothetical protein [Thalassospira profundimaris]|uniref:Uncharacterized protein n=1 Tax=Thalassospira profundimaris TaxID=502049 RepID=A0A367WP24_9PROT|nr:hypothetical protein [Thalassospira profundimaris]RCK43203.1 hypothetical protein TH30_19485 [Thalassospira profundimaris]
MSSASASEEWWCAHYREKVMNYLRFHRQFTKSTIRRHFGSDLDRERLDRVIQALVEDGTLRESGRRFFCLKPPPQLTRAPAVTEQTRAEFAAKSGPEKQAIAAAGDLRRQATSAAEKRQQRRMARRRLPSLGGPCQ